MRIALLFIIVIAVGCSSKVVQIKGHFTETPAPPPPDYARSESWAALPTKKDAADSVPLKSNFHDGQTSAQADVFFVHPTTFTEAPTNAYHWNADVRDVVLNQKTQSSTILNQASAFNSAGRIYAPYYRQAHLYAFYTVHQGDGAEALELAYQDVRAAFEYYLKYYNEGRPIILASHSQGSYHAERLVKDYFDGKPLQQQLVAAYLIGRAIRPDAFVHIKPTEKPDETGVWASWNTFARNHYPHNYDLYFKDSQSTNPLLWNSSEDFAPKELNHGGVAFHFTFAPTLADAQNHKGMLWINKPYFKGRMFIHTKRWHIADINLFYANIRENAELRVRSFLSK